MPKFWFRQKTFGFGAMPTTWQGWALTFFSCAGLFGIVLCGPAIRDNAWRALWIIMGSAAIVRPSCLIACAKTDGGWRWRGGNDS